MEGNLTPTESFDNGESRSQRQTIKGAVYWIHQGIPWVPFQREYTKTDKTDTESKHKEDGKGVANHPKILTLDVLDAEFYQS